MKNNIVLKVNCLSLKINNITFLKIIQSNQRLRFIYTHVIRVARNVNPTLFIISSSQLNFESLSVTFYPITSRFHDVCRQNTKNEKRERICMDRISQK